jgi:hypothetical protein
MGTGLTRGLPAVPINAPDPLWPFRVNALGLGGSAISFSTVPGDCGSRQLVFTEASTLSRMSCRLSSSLAGSHYWFVLFDA